MSSLGSSVGILILDVDLRVRSWDPWLARVTGIAPDAARGRALAALFPDLETRGMLRRLQQVVTDGTVQVLAPALHHYLIRLALEQPSRHFDTMQQRITMAPLRDGDAIAGALITIEDVTARLERELTAAEPGPGQDDRATDRITVDGLASALGDSSWQIRRAAASGLAQQVDSQVLPHLLRVLRHEYDNLSILNSALQTLALLSADSVEALGGLLDDPDAQLRMYATLALGAGTQRDRRVTPFLLRALEDPDANVRYHAIEGLGKLGTAEATDALLAIAETRDFFLAFPALDALANIGEARAAPRIVPLLDDELLRRPAIDALGRLGDQDVVVPLVELLNRPGAPAVAVGQALASVYERYERSYREGGYIADLVHTTISRQGIENLVAALDQANPVDMRALVTVLGWVEGQAVNHALARLLARPELRREVIEALVRHGPEVADLLIDLLASSEDPEMRQAAVIALGKLGDARAVPELTQVLLSDAELMVIAAGALAKIGDRRPFEALLSMLDYPDAAVRLAVVSALNSLGHPDMAARIAPLLGATDPHLRESAVRVAGYFGYDECVEGLLGACADADENVRRAAVEHLPYLDDARAMACLLQALRTDTSKVRAAAARALGQMPGAVAPLLEALQDPDAWVRYAAARALARQGTPEVLDALAERASDDRAMQVRIAALEALGEMGSERAVAMLAPIIESDHLELARASLRALGQIDHPDAVPPLLHALRSRQPLRVEAARALGRRRGPGTGSEVDALRWVAAGDANAQVVEAAIEALGHLGTPQAIAALVALAADPTRREACVKALAGLDDAGAADLADGLAYPQPASRRAVVDALAQMKRPYSSVLLGRALDHPDAEVRAAACISLARLGSRDYDRKLATLVDLDPDPNVQRAAKKALQ